ncbi:MAG: O-methyltransferase [Actinomycetota bacterium]
MRSSFGLDDTASAYLVDHSERPDEVQQSLIERTRSLGRAAAMQIAPEQGAFLTVLVGALQPWFAVEIGTFTGYSSIAIARGLAPGGRLLCCDVSEQWTSIARDHWAAAGIDDRIDLVVAPASDTLAGLEPDTRVDFAFIDADKTGYLDYYEALVPKLSPQGVIAVDNTLWSGQVLDDGDRSEDTVALRQFNRHVADDVRTITALTPIGDGVTLIRLRGA